MLKSVKKREKMRYTSDLENNEWELIKDFFKKQDNRGVEATHSKNPTIEWQVLVTPRRGIHCLSPIRCQGNFTSYFNLE